MHPHKILNIPSRNTSLQCLLGEELGISGITAQVLINRGIRDAKGAAEFLNSDLSCLLDPFQFSEMDKAVRIVREAARTKAPVMVFGDYDVDGITALALIKTTLSKVGINAVCHLPHRIKEGYGLNKNILSLVKENKARLLITVDCGTNSEGQIRELKRCGIEVIVTDHHEPGVELSTSAGATINPKVKGSNYGYRDLAGVGVAYKFCQAITGKKLAEELDLVSLGTIADVVPLTGENRIFVKEGLRRLSHTKRPGLTALIESSGIKDKKISSEFVSFILGPRINASGRMDTAHIALQLLLSEKKQEADELARSIESFNRLRQKIEGKILEEAQDLIDKEINFKEHKIIVIARENWHQGVLGIVASKLADRFYRPTILISIGDDLCRGSGRSIKNFHLFHALLECREFLSNFGGHAHAAGLVITKDNIADFKEKINRLAREKLRLADLLPVLDVDMQLDLSDLNEKIIEELQQLEPFGTGNPEPLFYTRHLTLRSQPQVLGRETLKFWVSDGRVTYPAIGFGMGYFKDSLLNAAYFDLVYAPRMDRWKDADSIILEVKDIFLGNNQAA
ncbi:MAG: single-stranded-DNA-specific exonuclease RecJ [Deltaproteobacteria bacterium]